MTSVYLDYNATTPIAPEVAEAMMPFLRGHYGNPSSSHPYGVEAKKAVEAARRHVAAAIGCDPAEVVFTSGGTESNNHAIQGVARAYRGKGNHIITSAVEHPAVIEVCRYLEKEGFVITVLSVDERGMVDPADLEKAIRPETILVTVMHSNNEVGTLQPVARLAEIARSRGVLFHSDAAQSVGKVPVDVRELGVDLLSVAGHKLYGPKGVGALYIRSGLELARILHGADHESGRRPGTENVLLVVGLGKACEVAARDLEKNRAHFRAMRDRLYEKIEGELGGEGIRWNGDRRGGLPNTLSLSFRGVEANTLLSEIGEEVAASAGAACHVDRVDVSAVLQAMNVPTEWAMGTVRLTTGRGTTEEEIDRAAQVITSAVRRLRPGGEEPAPSREEGKEIRLTRYTHGPGCACKLRPQELEKILASLPTPSDPNLLVGAENSDDAAVYRIDEKTALVQTVDFFTPVVDDPRSFGAIAAANSLSDIYAMGARPILALSIVSFPEGRLPLSVLERILEGAYEKAAEAGIAIAGGHTVEDTEPKYGLAVTGICAPGAIVRNDTARVGDRLVLTKPIGVGILATAGKRGLADDEEMQSAIDTMAALNRDASEAMIEIGVSACTDITGFGLLGHLREMALGSAVDVRIFASAVPILDAARRHAGSDIVPGGTINNLAHVEPHTRFAQGISQVTRILLADAQTSGGLLISVPDDKADDLLRTLHERGVPSAAVIGEVVALGAGRIEVAE